MKGFFIEVNESFTEDEEFNTVPLAFNNWLITNYINKLNYQNELSTTYSTKYLELLNTYQILLKNNTQHPYHLVSASPWPFIVGLNALAIVIGLAGVLHEYLICDYLVLFGIISFGINCIFWGRDMIREATFEGTHTDAVVFGLRLGVILFIVSEICIFGSFFWAFFHSSLTPFPTIAAMFPPEEVVPLDPWGVPFLNTLLLLTSGITITYGHYVLKTQTIHFVNHSELTSTDIIKSLHLDFKQRYTLHYCNLLLMKDQLLKLLNPTPDLVLQYNVATLDITKLINTFLIYYIAVLNYYEIFYPPLDNVLDASSKVSQFQTLIKAKGIAFCNFIFHRSRHELILSLLSTITLGILFTIIQYYEYKHAFFTMSDSIYGTTFYMITGLHGVHVILGTILLCIGLFRTYKYQFTMNHHTGLEAAIWYWHFVDVVWLAVYIFVYHWGGI